MLMEKKNLIKLCWRGLLLNHGSAAPPDFSVFFLQIMKISSAKDINKKERNLRDTETKELRNQKPKYKKRYRERRSEIKGERLCTKGKE